MLVKCNADSPEIENISHSVTLVPRLKYSVNLLNDAIDDLDCKRNDLKNANKDMIFDFDESDDLQVDDMLKFEYVVAFSLETLLYVKKSMEKISNVGSIPEILPSSIPVIRTISAKLFDVLPKCSQKLSELSVHLGSIVLDSAALTTARFDFSQSNTESSIILDEVKLMVNSKFTLRYDLPLEKIQFW
jgi:hypothetical protein